MRFLDRPWVDRVMLAGFRFNTRNALVQLGSERPRMPPPPRSGSAVLYVHVPFCEVLCPFCSFHRVQYRSELASRYFAALRREIRRYESDGFGFSSVYVGGGTPTVAPGELCETIALTRELFGVGDISVETNPKDLRPEILEELVSAGVKRLSVGVQSFDDGLLREMERYAKYGSGAEIEQSLQAAAGRFGTLNVDMIFNLPHQTRASLERDIETILRLDVNQASFYPLMTTQSTERKMEKVMGLPDKWRVREYYETLLRLLRPAFTPESAWCFSRGKGAIDEYFVDAEDYVGVGSGAFSYLDGTMYATTFSINGYIERVEAGQPAITGERRLTESEQMKQSFLVRLFGLRLEKSWIRQRYGAAFERELRPAILAYQLAGALVEDDTSYRLTDRGMYFWVLMMSSFFESVNGFREQMRARIEEELDEHERSAGRARDVVQPIVSPVELVAHEERR